MRNHINEDRLFEVCKMLASHLTLKQVADYYNCNPSTLHSYIYQHSSRLGLNGRWGLVLWALKKGYIKTDDIWLK